MLKLGIDIGSSTAKMALLNEDNTLLFKKYIRHNGKIKESLYNLLNILKEKKEIKK